MPDIAGSVGYYELPVPIVVADDVLGTVCATRIGDVPAQVHTPLMARDNLDMPALPPELPGVPADRPRIASRWDWVMTIADEPPQNAICLRRVGVVMEQQSAVTRARDLADGSLATRLGMAALDGMDEWVEGLRTWVEVLTRQDLDHRHPRHDVSYLGAGLWISKEMIPDIRLRQIEPMDLRRWRSVLERIGNNEEPPFEHLLARDARAAFLHGDFRRAAIDAGTATEMVLGNLYRDKVTARRPAPAPLLPEQYNLIAVRNALRTSEVHPAVPAGALDDLIDARNRAVHQGEETGADRLHDILITMTTLLAAHGPDPL